jgi:geranylgeranyl pyrophosphate synthase
MDGAKFDRALDLLRAPDLIAEARAMAAEQVKIARGLLAELRPSEYRDSLTVLIDDQINREV